MPSRIAPIVITATPDTMGMMLHKLRDYVSRAGHRAGLPQRSIYNLKLAVDEIATNIVTHGHARSAEESIITATATIYMEHLCITLEDSCQKFDPRQQATPNFDDPLETREFGGLGLYFALTSVDHYDYDYTGGCNRSHFFMERPEEARRNLLPYRILLYDALINHPESLASMLEPVRYSVVASNDHQTILRQISTGGYHVLMIGDGIDHGQVTLLLKQIRLLHEPSDTQILIASSDSSHIIRCLQLGATDYIRTPISPHFLTWRLSKMLETSNARLREQIAKLSRHIKSILLSNDSHLRFGKDLDFEQYLENVLTEVQGIYNADAGTVYLRTENDALRFAIVRTNSLGITLGGTSGRDIEFPLLPLYDRQTGAANHHNVATHVAITGETINIEDIYTNEDFDFSGTRWFDSHNHYQSVSTLTVPLKDHDDFVIGVIQLINAQDDAGTIIPFDDSHSMIVEALCAHTAVILSNQRLLERQEMLTKIENDIKIGRQIQRDFMPATIPEVEGWQVAAQFFPAREVAGDFYDIFKMNGFIVLIIADVCDKGVGAALFMALIRSLLRAFISQAREQMLALPADKRTLDVFEWHLRRVVEATNDYILEHHYELNMFATLFAGLLNVETGKLMYINGGHTPEPMVLNRAGGVLERLPPTGPAVGMFADAVFNVARITIEPDDVLVALTDGVTDIQNAQSQPMGAKAIAEMLASSAWDTVDELMTLLEDLLLNYKANSVQYDDMTFWMAYREWVKPSPPLLSFDD